jgi:hypothetical protein
MPKPVADRVTTIESQVKTLQALPGAVAALAARVTSFESQFLQFRAEVKDEFLQTRHELREEIRAGDEETRRYMRVLYEDLVARIMTIREK